MLVAPILKNLICLQKSTKIECTGSLDAPRLVPPPLSLQHGPAVKSAAQSRWPLQHAAAARAGRAVTQHFAAEKDPVN